MGVVDTATNITVCNQALGLLGAKAIVINTSSVNRTLCERFFADARDEILASHPWNYARKRANAIETTEPLFGFSHAFTMPSDCLRILKINDDPNAKWRREGDIILTDDGNTPATYSDDSVEYLAGEYITVSDVTYLVDTTFTSSDETSDLASYCTTQGGDYEYIQVEYIYQVTDLSSYPAYLKKCIIINLAIMLASPIKHSEKIGDFQAMLYGSKKATGFISMARSIDAQEAGGTVITTDTWIESRTS